MTNIDQEYDDYVRSVYGGPIDSPTQRQETRRAFFAGAKVMFGAMLTLGELSNPEAVVMMEQLNAQLESFKDWVGRGE